MNCPVCSKYKELYDKAEAGKAEAKRQSDIAELRTYVKQAECFAQEEMTGLAPMIEALKVSEVKARVADKLMSGKLKAETSSDSASINMPKWEEFTLTGAETELTLKEVPVGTAGAEIPFIYVVPKAGGPSKQYKIGGDASASEFKLAAATKTLTLPTGLNAGDKVYVDYEYACTKGFQMTASVLDKVREHKAVFLVLGHDVCDKNTQYAAYQVFPKAKLSPEIDLTFTPDMDHPFTLQCAQDYCDAKKRLFDILVDENGYEA